MILQPQFKDRQVCTKCGAPAMILGEPWTRQDGSKDWYQAPLEVKCSPHAIGCQTRERTVEGAGRRSKPVEYHVRVYTHMCIRNSYEDADGKFSDAPEHRYVCGALQQGMTRKAETLPAICYEGLPVPTEEAS